MIEGDRANGSSRRQFACKNRLAKGEHMVEGDFGEKFARTVFAEAIDVTDEVDNSTYKPLRSWWEDLALCHFELDSSSFFTTIFMCWKSGVFCRFWLNRRDVRQTAEAECSTLGNGL